MAFSDQIIEALRVKDGQTDRELTDLLQGHATHPSQVNQECNLMAGRGQLRREKHDGVGSIRNWIGDVGKAVASGAQSSITRPDAELSEDDVKAAIKTWLEDDGWSVQVAWGHQRGVDILGERGDERWLIEAKGCGSLQPMRVNYFIGMLGELLQRMDDPDARYSIAMPDMKQFRGLWDRLPQLAKKRVQVTALFVGSDHRVYPSHQAEI
tara:strand:+ start:1779 stop:2408 length:630 start_codon:yes stop_codon:yes gene_type:complete